MSGYNFIFNISIHFSNLQLMNKFLLTQIFLFFSITLFCQTKQDVLQLSAGKSFHGTGDLSGLITEVSLDHYFSKHFDLSNGLTTTIHYGKDEVYSNSFPSLGPVDRSFRYNITGIQLTSIVNYNLINYKRHKFKLGAGTVLRFQSSSYPDAYGLYFDPRVFPDPFFYFSHNEKQNIFTVGYSFGLTYIAKILPKYELGLKAYFQNDTNSDAITYISIIIGRILHK
jgi:hypothetical protein